MARTVPRADLDSPSPLRYYRVGPEHRGQRLDQVAAQAFADFSRARLQVWIKSGDLSVDGAVRRPKAKLHGGEILALHARVATAEHWQAEELTLDTVYHDEQIIVINKPAGLVVHPGAGVTAGTLLNGLLYHYPELQGIPRAGIVHRLDKDTTGLMVVARSLQAHHALIRQLQDHSLGRHYEAVVLGELTGGGTVDQPIGRHPVNRLKMAVLPNSPTARPAVTHYRLLRRFPRYTHIACQLETGRTHQIRVHLAYIRHPLVGDPLYSGRQSWLAGTPDRLRRVLADFTRQALHARQLTLVHPRTQQTMSWQMDPPQDMQQLLSELAWVASASPEEPPGHE